jgi:hypothetical protein
LVLHTIMWRTMFHAACLLGRANVDWSFCWLEQTTGACSGRLAASGPGSVRHGRVLAGLAIQLG